MIPNFNIHIDENDFKMGAFQLLQSVRPTWSESQIKLKVYTEGITNKLIGFYISDDPNDIVLFRLYGKNTDLIIDRKSEVQTMKLFSSVGCAAPLYATFQNGLCYGFIPGETLDEVSVRDPIVQRWRHCSGCYKAPHGRDYVKCERENVKLIAEAFVKIHRLALEVNGEEKQSILFPILKRYLSLVPSHLKDSQSNKRYREHIPNKTLLQEELILLENHLCSLRSPIVFCHNDALLKNIVYDRRKQCVTLIDYEYSGYNYQAFDIGNHFCEFAGVEETDFSRYPDREFQLKWLRTYLKFWHGDGDRPVSVEQVETLYVQVNKFALASNFMWGLWGIVQAANSSIDFDYLSFAICRFDEYFARKQEFLSLEIPN